MRSFPSPHYPSSLSVSHLPPPIFPGLLTKFPPLFHWTLHRCCWSLPIIHYDRRKLSTSREVVKKAPFELTELLKRDNVYNCDRNFHPKLFFPLFYPTSILWEMNIGCRGTNPILYDRRYVTDAFAAFSSTLLVQIASLGAHYLGTSSCRACLTTLLSRTKPFFYFTTLFEVGKDNILYPTAFSRRLHLQGES